MKRRVTISVSLLATLALLAGCSNEEPALPAPPPKPKTKIGTPTQPAFDPLAYAVPDRQLDDSNAAKLEAALLSDSDDAKAHIDLLWYYRGKFGDDDARVQANRHLQWLITHHPRAAVHGTPAAEVTPLPSREAYDSFEAQWLKQAQANPDDALIQGHAGVFMARANPPQAAKLLEKAIELDGENPLWSEHLAEVYREQATVAANGARARWAARALALYDVALANTKSELKQRYLLERMATIALMASDRDAASKHAIALLKLAKEEKPGADRAATIHNAHVVLGRLGLLGDDVKGAADHLAKAGEALNAQNILLSQLDLSLASAMLAQDDKQPAISYLQHVAKATQAPVVTKWITTVEAGDMPDFGPYLPQ